MRSDLLPTVLANYPPIVRPIAEPDPLGNAGGFSGARLWRFDAPLGRLVVRAWPLGGPDPATIRRIHGWIARAGDLGIVPVPLAALDGRTLVEHDGRIWEVGRWMPGEPDLGRPPARVRATFTTLAAFLARLAPGTPTVAPSPGLAARAEEIERLILGEFDALERAIRRPGSDEVAAPALAWLARARPLATRLLLPTRNAAARALPVQPCLRDARPDHFLFRGETVSGLVDFGAMGVDTVAGDLARLLAESIGPDRASRAVALAAFETIRPLSADESAAVDAFARANALLGPARWVRWHFVDRRSFDDPGAVAGGLKRGLERMDEAGL